MGQVVADEILKELQETDFVLPALEQENVIL